jgi:pimeloyl-ACP methyl ester carboxylesterase
MSRRGTWRCAKWVPDVRAAVDYLDGCPQIDPKRIGAFGFSSGGTAVLEAATTDRRIKMLVTLAATVRGVRDPFLALACRSLILLGRASRLLRGKDLRIPFVGSLDSVRFAEDDEANRAILRDPRVREAYGAVPFPGSADSYFVRTIRRVGEIRAPTLVLHGGSDRIDPPSSARLLFRNLTCSKSVHILLNTGHAAHLDAGRLNVMELTASWVKEYLM